MTTYTWTGSVSSAWTNSANWSPTGVPSSTADTAVIPGGSTIALTSAVTVQNLNISGTGAVTFTGGYEVTANDLNFTEGGETLNLGSSTLTLHSGITLSGTGTDIVSGGSVNMQSAVTIASGQVLSFEDTTVTTQAGFSGSGTLRLDGATVDVAGGSLSITTIDFEQDSSDGGKTNLLEIPESVTLGSITNFGVGDEIKVIGKDTVQSYSLTLNDNGTYTLKANYSQWWSVTISSDVTIQTGYTAADFGELSDGGFGFKSSDVGCFMPGTLLATPDGEIPVEQAGAGTLLLTTDGRAVPVRWLGRSTIASRFADPAKVLPIRILAGALGENLPARDLVVSPGHALLLDNVLVHAGALVNGVSILRETGLAERFTYYHVETDAHELLLAEGVAAESFLDVSAEVRFDNADERPTRVQAEEMTYPRALSARQLPAALSARLAARARLFGAEAA